MHSDSGLGRPGMGIKLDGLEWALFGKPGKGGISGPGLKMDLNANIGLTFTPIEWGNEQKHI